MRTATRSTLTSNADRLRRRAPLRFLGLVMLAGLPGLASCASSSDEGSAVGGRDARDLRGLVQQLEEAWARGDGARLGSLYRDDASHVTDDGLHLQGREAIVAKHQQLFDTYLRGSRLDLDITDLRRVARGVILIHLRGGVVEQMGAELTTERDSRATMVATEDDGEWRLVLVQVTRIAPVRFPAPP
jgi:uncharacterized protein (TIGR02246 family)